MGVFFVLLLVPMIIQHVGIKGYRIDYREKNEKALVFFFFFLTILIMFRHESVGTDTENYIMYFKRFARTDWSALDGTIQEVGYVYFNKVVSLFSMEPQVFLAIAAILVSVLIYPTYKRLCVDASLTIVLYCTMSTFVMMFSGIRQMIAIALGVVAYEFTRKHKLIPFLFVVGVAMTIHVSAFILVIMYPLYHAKITKKWLFAVVPTMVALFVYNETVFSSLSILIARYTRFEGRISATGAYAMLLLFVIFAVFAFVIPDESRMDKELFGLRNILLLAIAIQMFVPLHFWAMRMNYYFIIFIPLLLPKIIESRDTRWNQVAIAGRHIMVVFFLIYFFFNAHTGDNLDVFPYYFFWEAV